MLYLCKGTVIFAILYCMKLLYCIIVWMSHALTYALGTNILNGINQNTP